jgi:mycoredoxin
MTETTLIVYGTNWCGDCRRTQRFLQDNQVDYRFINIDQDKKGEQFVLTANRGMRSVPTIVFPDGSILVEPSNNQLAQKLMINSENYVAR